MKTIQLGTSGIRCSRLAYGCWRIAGSWDPAVVTRDADAKGREAVLAAYEAGYTLFDHADIYSDGMAESIFGKVLQENPAMRERVVIATKCGIRKAGVPDNKAPFRYDFSAEHILRSCEGSLKRLGVATIDLYQLHRPDFLMQPEEVAGAFTQLRDAGMVREFGVSNFKPSQVAALQKACPMRLMVNQVEISLANFNAINDGTLDQCLSEKITPMAWSPLAGGKLGSGAKHLLPSQDSYRPERVVEELDAIAKARGTSRPVAALAWLLKHPANIIPIIGSVEPANIRAAAQADTFELSREEWYRLLEAAVGARLP